MKETAIMIGPHISPVEQTVKFLQLDGVEVFWLQPGKEVASLPDPNDPTIVMIVVEDEMANEEIYAQMQGWKDLFPLGHTMILPLSNTKSWVFGISQIRTFVKAKQ